MVIELTPQQVNIILQSLNSAVVPVRDCKVVLSLIEHIENYIKDEKKRDYTQV